MFFLWWNCFSFEGVVSMMRTRSNRTAKKAKIISIQDTALSDSSCFFRIQRGTQWVLRVLLMDEIFGIEKQIAICGTGSYPWHGRDYRPHCYWKTLEKRCGYGALVRKKFDQERWWPADEYVWGDAELYIRWLERYGYALVGGYDKNHRYVDDLAQVLRDPKSFLYHMKYTGETG